MSDEKHSPGPWKWMEPPHVGDGPVLLDRNGNEVCNFGNTSWHEPEGGIEPSPADRTLIRLSPDMASMLRELEWTGAGSALGPWGGVVASCPICEAKSPKYDGNGHAPDCRLAALLAELP